MKTIKVELKETYGTQRVYPVCDTAILLARLTKQTTFTSRNVTILKQLGYTIQVVETKQELKTL